MNATELKQLSALTALNEMMQKGHFSICTIDQVAELLGVNPKGDAYNILRPLHCIDFAKMPSELRDAIPDLVQQCLGTAPTYRFTDIKPGRCIEVSSAPKKWGIRKLLGNGQ